MILEDDINQTNIYYRNHNIALIYKKPTPIRVVRVKYPQNKIEEAYFDEPSTLDYNGIYKGKYIEFDAKETASKTSFPLSNIHAHQMKHIRNVIYYGGIAFLVVRFSKLSRNFVLMGEDLIEFVDNNLRKSIPLDYFESVGFEVGLKYNPRLDYIGIIDNYIKDKDVGDNEN